ncbi:DNA-binding transcriptional repressor PuuR [Kibdelosporangium sp. 4NS15]|uniref:DNA-binding transcriptional repressor PuuR n=1 Tax=Kibdelosporangium persicum TaxID=2698649 RepID=A0ABX2F8T5_9PSEU|nr:DNA-binding transcriptional repressor PuuR [Kibdelosporangium persicum]
MVRLAEESEDRGWLVEYSAQVANWFTRYLGEETDANEIWTYQTLCVPGLLQTEAYTRAMIVGARPKVDPVGLRRELEIRRRRQERLVGDNPPKMIAMIDEAAVRRVVGGPDVMRRQLLHLVELAGRENVTVRVVPFAAGAHPAMITAFNLLHFPGELGDATIYVELYGGAVYPDGPDEMDRYTWMWRRLLSLALSPGHSAELLIRLAAELDSGK